MNEKTKYPFKFNYLALKLLGKNLYSNSFSAISELVANGLDAKATEVYVYIDIKDSKNATIEILDNGLGMDSTDIKNKYAVIGQNNRDKNSLNYMGRKGIGKLAALYLSDEYYISTKKEGGEESYFGIKFQDYKDEEIPELEELEKCEVVNKELFNTFGHGTVVSIKKANLVGLGDKAKASLSRKLANYFSIEEKNNTKIMLFVNTKNSKPTKEDFKEVKKAVAFKNMSQIYMNLPKDGSLSRKLECLNGHKISMIEEEKYEKLDETKISVEQFNDKFEYKAKRTFKNEDDQEVEKEYEMRGWVGIHSTINMAKAGKNDTNFVKNKYYNPNQVRLYVRGKLAIENCLPLLQNTQNYVNYIEGEVHFDILDDSDLKDIATSNRQGLDENDQRVTLLVETLKKIVIQLIKDKNTNNKDNDKKKKQANEKAKNILLNSIKESMIDNSKSDADITDQISLIKKSFEQTPDAIDELKTDYVLFFSHRRKDKKFVDFFYFYLKEVHGVEDREIFYTSKDGGQDQDQDQDDSGLELQIKNSIVKSNTAMIYFCSQYFRESDYCMFEGGAGWAVKSLSKVSLITLDNYNTSIPSYLKTKDRISLDVIFCKGSDKKPPALSDDIYIKLLKTLNWMIKFLNNNRTVADKTTINEIEIPKIQSKVLAVDGHDCKDVNIVAYWEKYIMQYYLDEIGGGINLTM